MPSIYIYFEMQMNHASVVATWSMNKSAVIEIHTQTPKITITLVMMSSSPATDMIDATRTIFNLF